MKLEFLEPYVAYLTIALIGSILLYLRTYLKERAKISALKSQNEKLINQSESIKAIYSREIEEVKKNHQLDLEKRKYQYESKQKQYIEFFKFLDNFSGNYNIDSQRKILPILEEFNRNYLHAANTNNQKGITNASTVLSAKIQKLMNEANEELTRIKQETNTIRLIASDSVLNRLNVLELAYDKTFEESATMMSKLPAQLVLNDQEGMKESQNEIEILGKVILSTKDKLIKQMRTELNEI
ncbi:hypothetical protein [Labilibaculum euxinus]|uniref:Uncharacterized protein n=1 Tax=Labilibaculum euxinus TaxID=2686357 RepID=A0A7M4D6S0_9BACT|nr:hypothetical protein [Labilibaculum euxinus]MUP38349.1 hypothetical protein [Labilibaculum euxinus]MVB07554.1 hypothetical protein [Labilibaculum euxinus]